MPKSVDSFYKLGSSTLNYIDITPALEGVLEKALPRRGQRSCPMPNSKDTLN